MGFFSDIIADGRPVSGWSRRDPARGAPLPDGPLDAGKTAELPPGEFDFLDRSENHPAGLRGFLPGNLAGEKESSAATLNTEPPASGNERIRSQERALAPREKPVGPASPAVLKKSLGVGPAAEGKGKSSAASGTHVFDPLAARRESTGEAWQQPDRNSAEPPVDVKERVFSQKPTVGEQKSGDLSDPGRAQNPAATMAGKQAERVVQSDAVVAATVRRISRKTTAEGPVEPPPPRDGRTGFSEDHNEPGRVEGGTGYYEPVSKPGAVKLEDPDRGNGEQDVMAGEADAPLELTELSAERDGRQIHDRESPERPQVSIGCIEVIVEVSDPPAAEKASASKPASRDLSSRYYLRRV